MVERFKVVWFYFGAKPHGVQALFLVLHAGITPDSQGVCVCVLIWIAGY